jgi:hypothetical protein
VCVCGCISFAHAQHILPYVFLMRPSLSLCLCLLMLAHVVPCLAARSAAPVPCLGLLLAASHCGIALAVFAHLPLLYCTSLLSCDSYLKLALLPANSWLRSKPAHPPSSLRTHDLSPELLGHFNVSITRELARNTSTKYLSKSPTRHGSEDAFCWPTQP